MGSCDWFARGDRAGVLANDCPEEIDQGQLIAFQGLGGLGNCKSSNVEGTQIYKTVRFSVLGHNISLLVPQDEEMSLNAAVFGDGIDPYWGKVWDSAVDSAQCILRSEMHDGTRTLELGCGTGLVGIAALLAGHQVTFSDHDPRAVELAMKNAQLNSQTEFDGVLLDWDNPLEQKFDLIVASDILYESSLHRSILNVGQQMLFDHGRMCIGDPGRQLAREFLNLASEQNWSIQIFDHDMNAVMTPFNNQFQWLVFLKE